MLLYIYLFFPYLQQKKPIGESIFCLNDLEYNLNLDKLSKIDLNSSSYGNLGIIQINYDERIKETFLDYLNKGMQINLDIE